MCSISISRGFGRHENKDFDDVFKGPPAAFVLQEKSKLRGISEAKWHWVRSGANKTFMGKGELDKTHKETMLAVDLSQKIQGVEERNGGTGVFKLSQWTL